MTKIIVLSFGLLHNIKIIIFDFAKPDRLNESKINIAFIDTTYIIFKGLSGMFQQTGQSHMIRFYPCFDMFLKDMTTFDPQLVIVNPLFVQNNMKVFLKTRNASPVKWVGVLYSFYDREVLSVLDGTIQITDSYNAIKTKIEKLLFAENRITLLKEAGPLTPRETDILRLITQGLSNKEIACKLNISIHTVVTHRRKIINKTGSSSPYDLFAYATANKIIETFQF